MFNFTKNASAKMSANTTSKVSSNLSSSEFVLTPPMSLAHKLLKQHENILIVGKAGSGKSSFLRYFTQQTSKNYVVLAPTGVSAINIQGQTIHSFFEFGININPIEARTKRYSNRLTQLLHALDILIIDEISMVRADLLDSINFAMQKVLKNKRPFGGIQTLFIGDLFQLPPVIQKQDKEVLSYFQYNTFYFFSSHVLNSPQYNITPVIFDKIFRQKQEDTDNKRFVTILNKIRTGKATDLDLAFLNKKTVRKPHKNKTYIYLTSTNKRANTINSYKLAKLPGKQYTYHAQTTGDFQAKKHIAEEVLKLKINAQVMLINNDKPGRWINGTMGTIIDIKPDPQLPENSAHKDIIYVQLSDTKQIVEVQPNTWEQYKYTFNKEKTSIETDIIGTLTQYPIKLAWAVTIHKSQGQTFDNVILDLSTRLFAPGQLYVALSRVRSIKGLILSRPLKKHDVIIDQELLNWWENFLNRHAKA